MKREQEIQGYSHRRFEVPAKLEKKTAIQTFRRLSSVSRRTIFGKLTQVVARLNGHRTVILHNHVFKNAGSTIDWALHNSFGDGFVDHRDDAQMKQGADYLRRYLLENKAIRALSSHHLTMPLPEIPRVSLLTILMIRHPIERIVSVYNFERAQDIRVHSNHPGVVHANKFNLKDYIVWRMNPNVGATIRNFQVRKLLPPRKAGQEVISDTEMEGLKADLKRTAMLGMVARFDESMVLFEDQFHSRVLGLDLSYVAQNVSTNRRASLTANLEELRAEIGDSTYELLLENNQRDLQLFDLVEGELDFRISKVKQFSKKLSEFRSRCMARAVYAS